VQLEWRPYLNAFASRCSHRRGDHENSAGDDEITSNREVEQKTTKMKFAHILLIAAVIGAGFVESKEVRIATMWHAPLAQIYI